MAPDSQKRGVLVFDILNISVFDGVIDSIFNVSSIVPEFL